MVLINSFLIPSKSAFIDATQSTCEWSKPLTPKQQYTVEINMTATRMMRQLMKKPAIASKLQRGNMIDPHSLPLSEFLHSNRI